MLDLEFQLLEKIFLKMIFLAFMLLGTTKIP